MHWFLDPVKNHYFDFEGRATRKQYWMFVLMYIIISIIVELIDVALGLGFLGAILSLVLLAPSLGIAARRLHDIGRSGWWQLIGLIPIIGWIIMIVWLVTDSAPDNQYGPNPKGGAGMAAAGPMGEEAAPAMGGEAPAQEGAPMAEAPQEGEPNQNNM